jgi:steroid delta-isomerase-like uncharacterized protein
VTAVADEHPARLPKRGHVAGGTLSEMSDANIAVIRRFYEELWNRGDLAVAQELLQPEIRFRGSFGTTIEGIPAFMRYVERTRAAFPDWHNRIDELIAADEKVVARMTWTGTHQGEFFGIPPTGRTVAYVGAAIFEIRHGKIHDGWVVGDTQELWRALGVLVLPGDDQTTRGPLRT